MSIERVDAMGNVVRLAGPAQRVVSLVPSESEAVFQLGRGSRLIGRTRYCVEPRGEIESVVSVGGTKDASSEQIIALAPDLVLANQEENTPDIVRTLREAGLRVHVSFPKTVEEAAMLMRDIAVMLGVEASHPSLRTMEEGLAQAALRRRERAPVRVFCPIWMEPLMTIHGETFISDMLDLAGGANVFADRLRRYPLAADLGLRAPLPADRVKNRDVRYPRVSIDELVARDPDIILLPDEPHPFNEADSALFRALEVRAARNGHVYFIDGKDLCWYSARMGAGVARISACLDRARA